MDQSPRDHQLGMCAILCLSETLDGRHVASSGASDRHRRDQGFIRRGFKCDSLIFFSPWTARDRAISIRRWRDRDPIVAQSGFLRGEIKATSLPTDSEGDCLSTKLTIVARSWLLFEAKVKLIHHRLITELNP